MGFIGNLIGKGLGGAIGGLAGSALGPITGVGAGTGSQFGSDLGGHLLGNLIPFKKGGRVKRTGPIYAHKGEFILPKSVKPTKAQLSKVTKMHHRKPTRRRKSKR